MNKIKIASARNLIILLISLLFIGCSAKVKFLDQQNGNSYYGETGSTIASTGKITANIENENYSGDWIYSASGGGFTMQVVGTTGGASSFGSGIVAPISGNGLITLKGNNGGYIRCVYNFSEWTDTGTGECKRNDGKSFDVFINR